MDVEDLRRIGLLKHWEALDHIASAPLSAEDVEDVLEANDDVTRSRWSPEGLAEQFRHALRSSQFTTLDALFDGQVSSS